MADTNLGDDGIPGQRRGRAKMIMEEMRQNRSYTHRLSIKLEKMTFFIFIFIFIVIVISASLLLTNLFLL